MGKRVLVTGATGFLGSHLCPALTRRGDEVFALFRTMHRQTLFRSNQTVILGDAKDQSLIQRVLSEYEIDAVIHLAAQTQVSVGRENPASVIQENIMGTLSVLEAARLQKTDRVILASTDKVYGTVSGSYVESMPLNERTPYGASKACADILAQTYINTYGMSLGITRCGNLFGPGHMNWSTIIPGTIKSYLMGSWPTLRFAGMAVRDFLYVDDAVDGYLKLLDSRETGAFNFSGGRPITIKNVVMLIADILRVAPKMTLDKTGIGEIQSQTLDCTRAKEVLKWKPSETFITNLEETVKWYINHLRTESALSASCSSGTKTGFSDAASAPLSPGATKS